MNGTYKASRPRRFHNVSLTYFDFCCLSISTYLLHDLIILFFEARPH